MKKQTIIIASSIAGLATLSLAAVGGTLAYQSYQANQTCAKVEAKIEEALQNGKDSIKENGEALAEMKAAAAVRDYSTFYQAQRKAEEGIRKTNHYASLIRKGREEYFQTCKLDARRKAFGDKAAATFIY